MNNNAYISIKFLANNPLWMAMDWEVRGMATQIMALGDFDNHKGSLPPEDSLWRSSVGIPTKSILRSAQRKVNNTSSDTFDIIEAWEKVWRPQLIKWFILIDDELIAKKPHLKDLKGRYWHALLELWEEQEKSESKAVFNSKRAASKKTTTKTVSKKARLKKSQDLDPYWDYPIIGYSDNAIRHNWETPISKETRSDLWRSASDLLSTPGDSKSEASARQYLGKLIKDFGEKNVASAVAQLMVRAVMPADPKSFLRKQLKIMTQGTEKEQKARSQRMKVSL